MAVEGQFYLAAVGGDVQRLSELIAAGADVNAKDKVSSSRCTSTAARMHRGMTGLGG
jgi:hypothetical protein